MVQNNDYKPGIADDCSCPKTTCSMWGSCRECVSAHRAHEKHVPHCMQLILKKAVKNLAELIECDLIEQKRTK
jgi:hypothetical protein